MRIALFHGKLPCTGTKPSGADVYVARLAAALAAADHEVETWTFGAADPIPGVQLRALRPAGWGDQKVLRQYAAPLLLNLRGVSSSDVLHLFGDDTFFVRRRIPTVRTFLGSALFESLSATSTKRRINQAITFRMEQVAGRIANARYGIGPDSELLYHSDGTLPSGIDLPAEPADGARPRILFIGTWAGRKRGRLLHQAFVDHVQPALPKAELVMVSDHCDVAPGITWVQVPSDAEIARLYASSRTFCLPSSYEGFGMPYLEAMSHGVHVVATPNFGSLALLQGTPSSIVGPDALGPALLASLLRSQEQIAADAASLRSAARRYSWSRAVELHEQAYALAIDRFTRGVRR
ncbi:MAG: glycosyltransferase family 4 protein [Solirubrobacteraceae bacterium]